MKEIRKEKPFKIGSTVEWNWMGRKVRGSIKKVYFKPVTRQLSGKPFTRRGSRTKPAYLVKSNAGTEILKLHTELQAVRG